MGNHANNRLDRLERLVIGREVERRRAKGQSIAQISEEMGLTDYEIRKWTVAGRRRINNR